MGCLHMGLLAELQRGQPQPLAEESALQLEAYCSERQYMVEPEGRAMLLEDDDSAYYSEVPGWNT